MSIIINSTSSLYARRMSSQSKIIKSDKIWSFWSSNPFMGAQFTKFLRCFALLTLMNLWLLCSWWLLAFCFSSMAESCWTLLPFFPFRPLLSSFWHFFHLDLWNKVSRNLIFTLLFRSLLLLPLPFLILSPSISLRVLFSSLAHVAFSLFSIWLLLCYLHKSIYLELSRYSSAASLLRQRNHGLCYRCCYAPPGKLDSWAQIKRNNMFYCN